ncbi:hypothetical protein MNBD_ALPHA12-733 [hydrothermal vent metagenome]|uniref:Serine aminopeptidase S33 domain-containing protein n=1 Tax=hydrothermal vent metagenome TaxID=652676 RepID=A0A3B0TKA6_9ZZZZ
MGGILEEIEISFKSGAETLFGALTVPEGVKNPPMVLFIGGSGPLDRNENAKMIKLNIFNTLAKTLAGNGIASLRYDKRGCGKSEGNYFATGHFQLVDDAERAFEFMKTQHHVKPGPLYIAGHSEGTIIAPQISNRRHDVSGIILVAPFLQKLDAVLVSQAAHMADDIKTMPGIGGFLTRFAVGLMGGVKKKQAKTLNRLKNSKKDVIRVGLQKLNAKWFRELFSLDPAHIMAKIDIPTLIIAGEKDMQCAPEDAAKIARTIGEKAQYHLVDNLTHIMRLETGPASIINYKQQLKKPIAPIVGELMVDWIRQN